MTSLTLYWSCSDPEGDPITYDIYFGTANPPTILVGSNKTEARLTRDNLSNSTNYYWKIIAKDSHGNSSSGPIWQFTTGSTPNNPPAAPNTPSPSNNAVDQTSNLSLSWNCSDPENDPLFYDVYFGTSNPPTMLVSQNQRTTSFDKSGLSASKAYYWKIAAKDDHDHTTMGPVWKFTTATAATVNNPPSKPASPSPSINSVNNAVDLTLSWTCSDPEGDPLTYNVYFGTSNPPTTVVAQNQSGTNLNRSGLSNNTTYYWRVLASDDHGNTTNGPVWYFATTVGTGGTAPAAPTLNTPSNVATDIATNPTLVWNAASGATSYTLQVSTSNTFSSFVYNQGAVTGTSQVVSGLANSTNYYWRVSATNSYGTSAYSTVYSFTTTAGGTVSITWISIPAGNFTMGSLPGDPYANTDEQPQHTVYLDAYQISKYEITNAQYKVFMDVGGYSNSAYWTTDGWTWKTSNSITEPYYWTAGTYNSGTGFPNHPVVGVSWYEAYAFCNWAGGSLPTEAQWEKAARGTVAANYWPWGSAWNASKCNSYYNTAPDTFAYSSPVGFFSTGTSPYGVYDMAGNVWEWCNDWYQSDYYSTSPSSNPAGPTTGSTRVIRGGSWDDDDYGCRSAYRDVKYPDSRGYGMGFRPAK